MPATNRWSQEGTATSNALLRVKLTLTAKAATSGATAAVDDYYEFDCIEKGLPKAEDNPTWNYVTDNPDEVTGYTYSGKAPQLSVMELTTKTPLPLVYGDLLQHKAHGDIFTATYTYDDPKETNIFTITLAQCRIIGIDVQGGDNANGSKTVIKVQPTGGSAANMPAFTSAARSAS